MTKPPLIMLCTDKGSMQGRTGFSNRPWQKYSSGPFDHGSVVSEASGACNGWGLGGRLMAPLGVQGAKPPGKFGVSCNFRVGERRFSDDFFEAKS